MVYLYCINVNAVDSLSGIFAGYNKQNNWNSVDKTNSGFGKNNGENIIVGAIDIVIDPDHMDNPGKIPLKNYNVQIQHL